MTINKLVGSNRH